MTQRTTDEFLHRNASEDDIYLRTMLVACFDPEITNNDDEARAKFQQLVSTPEDKRRFRALFSKMMSDSSKSFAQKARYFCGAWGANEEDEEAARQLLGEWWQMAFGEPYKWNNPDKV